MSRTAPPHGGGAIRSTAIRPPLTQARQGRLFKKNSGRLRAVPLNCNLEIFSGRLARVIDQI
jgi:hypothetical protein